MNRRRLSFSTYDDVIAEIERLEGSGYERLGEWSLEQVCRHLGYYMRGSLDGFDFMLPWIVRKLIGRPMLKKMLAAPRMKPGMRTVPASVPEPENDDREAVDEAKGLLRRLADHSGELHPSPLFDRLTADQWRQLHVGHAAHHLGFLIPKEPQ